MPAKDFGRAIANTYAFQTHPKGAAAARVMAAALQAVEPGAAVRRFLRGEGEMLEAGGRRYDLSRFRRVRLVGAGKAGAPMARAAGEFLGERLEGGVMIVKEGHLTPADRQALPQVTFYETGHPVPDERGVRAARAVQAALADTTQDDLVIGLISGGGSALMVSPAEGVTLEDLQQLTKALLASGANIEEINTLRKHLDTIKGGGLARLAAPATLVTLILSDVVGDPLDVIASGPTVPDPTTYGEAMAVLERYGLVDRAPRAVVEHLERGRRGELPETPKADDPLFERVQNVIVGSNRQAAEAALAQARAEDFQPLLLTTFLQGEARQAGRFLAAVARQAAISGQPVSRPGCIIAGGETTVTVRGEGLGGRNQELALGAAADLAGLEDVALAALGTDGGDGPTDAAGAVVTGETLERARRLGLAPADFLERNDAYHFFEPLGDLIRTGPTQTNVNDLAFVFLF